VSFKDSFPRNTPHSAGENRPNFVLPTDACDCHMHLFDRQIPFISGVQLIHDDASVEDYCALQHRLGLKRCVIVQPSSYGRDNRVLLAGLQNFGSTARGIAVIAPDVSDNELITMKSMGVVGVRFNLVQQGATDDSMLEAVARRIRQFGWHIQLHLLSVDFLRLADFISRLEIDIVIDHFARIQSVPNLAPQVERKLMQLLDTRRVWIKLSGAYLASKNHSDFVNLDGFVSRLLASHSDRVIWGTDWPHVTEAKKPNDADLTNLLLRWVPNETLRRRILVDNPNNLYFF
jgi:D-galactarolactone isomerase